LCDASSPCSDVEHQQNNKISSSCSNWKTDKTPQSNLGSSLVQFPYTLRRAAPFHLKFLPFPWRGLDPGLIHGSAARRLTTPSGISTESAVLPEYTGRSKTELLHVRADHVVVVGGVDARRPRPV